MPEAPPLLDLVADGIDGVRSASNRGRFRRLPPAITPVRGSDIAAGVAGQAANRGRDEFRYRMASFLDADGAGSYTSFRRALCACLLEVDSAADGSEVLIPAFCSSDFPDAIEGAGLDPVRYDVDPETLAADQAAIESLPTADVLAVVVVNVLGYGSRMERIETYCRENDLVLLEALGYAVGASYGGRRLGTFGDCSVLNFQQGKPIPVGGGLVCSRNDAFEFTDRGRGAVDPNLGALLGYAAFGHPRLYALYSSGSAVLDRLWESSGRHSTHPEAKFDVRYEPPFATMSDFQGSIASRILGRLPDHRRHRAATARFYASGLHSTPHLDYVRPVEGLVDHQHVRFPLMIDDDDLREAVQDALSAIGVETGLLYDWPPIEADRFPGAARLQEEILTLPTHPYVDETDRQEIVDRIRQVVRSRREDA